MGKKDKKQNVEAEEDYVIKPTAEEPKLSSAEWPLLLKVISGCDYRILEL